VEALRRVERRVHDLPTGQWATVRPRGALFVEAIDDHDLSRNLGVERRNVEERATLGQPRHRDESRLANFVVPKVRHGEAERKNLGVQI
jgi:hypothetical protein